ncbi:MAG: PDZ domain-containing protein [Acidobacteriota bacterium]|nr:PDZ domain-containing protein [Acidobacteriota bacterium]
MRFRKVSGVATLALGSAAVISMAVMPAHGQVRAVAPSQRAPYVVSMAGGGRIGVTIDDVDAGVRIEEVEESAPAAKAGLKKGDVFVEFDGEKVRSVRQLTRLIQETPEGRKVPAVVTRGGQRVTVTLEPESRSFEASIATSEREFLRTPELYMRTIPAPRAPRAPRAPQALRAPTAPMPPQIEIFRDGFAYSFGGGRLGVTTEGLSAQLAKHFGVDGGVLVSSVSEDSAASKAGIRAGDVITKVNSAAIDDAADLIRELGRANGEVAIEIVRDRKTQTVKATLEDTTRPRGVRRIL